MFQKDDFELLDELVLTFHSVVTTPHVLTEVSNHARHMKGPLGESLLKAFAQFSLKTEEHFRAAIGLATRNEFTELGLTDCALADLSSDITVITTDFRLADLRSRSHKPVINFNLYRQARFFHE